MRGEWSLASWSWPLNAVFRDAGGQYAAKTIAAAFISRACSFATARGCGY